MHPILKIVAFSLTALIVSACVSTGGGGGLPGSPGGQKIPGPQIPVPPSGGGGLPGSDPSGMPPSKPPSGSQGGSEGKGDGESGEESSIPDEWEDDSDGGEGSAENGAENGDVSFEDDDTSFEQPDFEDDGGLSEKELEELEKELDESLGDFDEEIQREKDNAEEQANKGADGEGGIGAFETYEGSEDGNAKGSSQTSSTGAQQGQANGSASGSESGGGSASDRQANAENKGKQETIGGDGEEEAEKNGPDIPIVRDNEDIVARQIREAAESETDPELKAKLWEEYRKYTRQ